MQPENVPAKLEVRSLSRLWDNRGTWKFAAAPGYALASFGEKFLMAFCWDGPCEWTGQSRSP